MLGKNLFVPPAGGFIAGFVGFAPGGSHPLAPPPIPAEAADASALQDAAWSGASRPIDARPRWQPGARGGVGNVETAVFSTIFAYMALALVGALGIF